MKISSRLLSAIGLLLVTLTIGLAILGWQKGIPVSAAGMASKMTCSGVFVAGRPASDILENDVRPASIVLRLVDVDVDERARVVKASLPGTTDRYAVYKSGRGCVLLEPGDLPTLQNAASPSLRPVGGRFKANYAPVTGSTDVARVTAAWTGKDDNHNANNWPQGSLALQPEQWPASINRSQLENTVEKAFTGPPVSSFRATQLPVDGPNTRSVLVVHKGKLLIERYGAGFDNQTPQLGWSMAKTVLSVLVWQQLRERGIDLNTPVVDLVQRVPQPRWAGEWLRDDRASITIEHLLTMRDGLAHEEGYSVFSDVPRMLFAERDIGRYAGTAPIENTPGSHWRYASAVSNLASRVLRAQFSTDREYWQYPYDALFGPIGADSAIIESDSNGTLVASSFMWATAQDWARIGQVLLDDGAWQGHQVFEPGWRDWASSKRAESPYGAHVWLTGQNNQLKCGQKQVLPTDGLVLKGHWGQFVAIFPEQEVVIVRLGWTLDPDQFNACQFIHEVLSAVGTES